MGDVGRKGITIGIALVSARIRRARWEKSWHGVMTRTLYWVFLFQAEEGIRDVAVTGVQTCALPIYLLQAVELTVESHEGDVVIGLGCAVHALRDLQKLLALVLVRPFRPRAAEQALDLAPHLERSEERRVGKGLWCGSSGECQSDQHE